MSCLKNAPPVLIGEDPIDLSKDSNIVRSGIIRIRGVGKASGRLWKTRRLTLVENALLILHPSLSQRLLKRIPTKSIINIERTDLKPACLYLEISSGKRYYFAFENDALLYDWQDDIYPRSRLGNLSSPFNFVHEVHLTGYDYFRNTSRLSTLCNRMQASKRRSSVVTSHRASSELSDRSTRRQSFYPRRASYDSCMKKPSTANSTHKRNNSASSSFTSRFVSDPSTHPSGSLSNTSPPPLLEGLYQVKQPSIKPFFSFWRLRYVVLTPRSLQIHKTQLSRPEITIQLPHIIDVSQLKLSSKKPFVLNLATPDNRRYHISLPNTSDLQRWNDFIASRSRRRAEWRIGPPEGFEFPVHVGWDEKTQTVFGLPDEWKTSLEKEKEEDQEGRTGQPNDDSLNQTVSPVTTLSGDSSIKPLCPSCYGTVLTMPSGIVVRRNKG
ncbi:hypothetical protein AGABI1DRAFT_108395 [Agaricus bisporus var. burnettii JB137-S8]|uniref:PH domain-containing protein n=1 Tax=Agaricus bisporus var. burnettii (strain JB137-S8 / ATCC MYA-4627 / FGSC 10392) TaxID=597362 RepID=K5VR96_AGABU|nr:uncharacterized protein AGABI1DRAFT_108395 [Agaricus bisporus var. burnettii JB137-S8]EKM76989.1 hypothetical protein AGABI1DRAFT_108395 [Agaricus bisporus var. burnettii JB137-S8]